ncbi:MAG TPA: glutamine--fructose-6-phosphate transaminase (isomerizing) [Actinomycetota bacterium]|nr:glutamine--fructose-6-phosphate transaminase (isomerizing) [Actinomycetota bacterium]
MGVVAREGAVTRSLRGLQALEYRGYDSYGIALLDGGLRVDKDVGSIGRAVEARRFDALPDGALALAHTRWATHGGVTQANAHPHVSYDGRVAVVHNGVIENHADIRRKLEVAGVTFVSETDTEVVPHLIARELETERDAVTAIARAVSQLDGEYALGIAIAGEADTIYGVKRKSPLLLTWNGSEAMLASDQMAAVDVSDQLVYLHDGDIVRLQATGAEVFSVDSGLPRRVERAPVTAARGYERPDKAGYDHYMLKEMYETVDATRAALRVAPADLRGAIPPSAERVTLIGSGSAFYVGRIAQYFFGRLVRNNVHALPSDEAPYWMTFDERDAVIAVSQSGETFDTLEVARLVVDSGAHLTSVTNVPNSTLERLASHRLPQSAGPEICVLSTKSVVNQVVLLVRVALQIAADRDLVPRRDLEQHQQALEALPATLEALLGQSDVFRKLAAEVSSAEHWFFVGRGPLYPVALESALKFKEVSYRHAEGLPAGFFKHGTISLIDEDFYTVALLPSKRAEPERFRATLANVSEIVARRGPVLGFGPDNVDEDDVRDFASYVPLPYLDDDVADVVVQLLAGQLFAYYCALSLGREIDQPRSLAKSVTVR